MDVRAGTYMIIILYYYICVGPTCVRTCSLTYMYTCVRAQLRTRVRKRVHACEGPCACVRERLHMRTRVGARVCGCAYVHARVMLCMRLYA